jgi:hypothetical protein
VELSLQQNVIDLGWHQKEFQRKPSFAYTVVILDEKRVIGCIYIYSTDKGEFDAEITMGAHQDAFKDGYDVVFKTVKEWVANEWPLVSPACPSSDITWEKWENFRYYFLINWMTAIHRFLTTVQCLYGLALLSRLRNVCSSKTLNLFISPLANFLACDGVTPNTLTAFLMGVFFKSSKLWISIISSEHCLSIFSSLSEQVVTSMKWRNPKSFSL